jgi:alpha-D-ribose 1-methylphosphonate 5-triphosphate synthase subunit PhnH
MSACFTDPTRQTQQVFRAILEALARPTRPFPLDGPTEPPEPMGRGLAAVALTLCDEDTPVWIDPVLAADGAVAAWFAFYTGAPVISDPALAAFVFALGFDRLPPPAELAAGTDEQPHRSATAVLDVAGHGTGDRRLRATGPGIDGYADFAAPWAPPDFVDRWRANTERFPMGVDLLLVEGAQIRGLPRTTVLDGVA